MKTQMYGRNILRTEIPRLALSASGKASFLRTRLEALWAWGGNPFHPKRIKIAGLAVTLGIVAIIVAMFGQSASDEYPPIQLPKRLSGQNNFDPPQGSSLATVEQLHDIKKKDFRWDEARNNYVATPNKTKDNLIIVIDEPVIYINGNKEQELGDRHGFSDIMAFHIRGKGLFMVSLKPFKGATQAGIVKENEVRFQLGAYKTRIISHSPILIKPEYRGKEVPVYAALDKYYDLAKLGAGSRHLPEYQLVVAKIHSSNPYFVLAEAENAEAFYNRINEKPALSFANPKIQVDEKEIHSAVFPMFWQFEEPTLSDEDVYVISEINVGLFLFSAKPFKGATQIAEVQDKTLRVQTPVGSMTIQSEEPILNTPTGKVWFAFRPATDKIEYSPQRRFIRIERYPIRTFKSATWLD